MKKSLSLVFALSVVALQGCLATAVVAGAAATTAVVYDNRSTKTMVDDRDISYKAQYNLSYNKELHTKAHVNSAVFNRVLLLVGQAPTEDLRNLAENEVKSIPKVKLIHNEITIEPPVNTQTQANDTWITTKIKSALLADKGLVSAEVKVVTENGVVYLLGLVNKSQADQISEIVRKTEGVKKVVKLFEYTNKK